MNQIIVICHNIRSAHNVGSILRTADGFGVKTVFLSGYTPYPLINNDSRLPHIAKKLDAQIAKTALGAEKSLDIKHVGDIFELVDDLKSEGYSVVALEQTPNSVDITNYKTPQKIAIILGREVEGIEVEIISCVDGCLEIPMLGKKESFNVSVSCAVALYHLRLIGSNLIK